MEPSTTPRFHQNELPVNFSRKIINTDSLLWMESNRAPADTSVITSLPDVSEMSGMSLNAWKDWFIAASAMVMNWVTPDAMSIFYQTDIRHSGVWVDKSFLLQLAAQKAGVHLLFHKIMCRKPPGTITAGRPTYAHMLGFSGIPRKIIVRPGPDILADVGAMNWPRAMGVDACRIACRYIRSETASSTILDPFCGQGTVPAVANSEGFSAIGIDRSTKRCRAAAALAIPGPPD